MLNALRARPVSIAITEKDRRYMDAIPAATRLGIMRRMMCGAPIEEQHWKGNTSYVKAILRLRASGLRLIDLQRQDIAFSAVWYRKGASVLGLQTSEAIALLVWELGERDEELTTLKIWRT
jgi:hypothetical protein